MSEKKKNNNSTEEDRSAINSFFKSETLHRIS